MLNKVFEIITGEKIRKQKLDIIIFCAVGLVSGLMALIIAMFHLALALMLIGYSVGFFVFALKIAYDNDMLF